MDDNKRFWQRFAKLYSPFMERGSKQLYENICAEVKPNLNKDMKVLELACGSGQLSFRLAEQAKEWIATDFSENMIAEAKKQSCPKSLSFEVQDATSLPYPSESVDAVVIANALHIMPEPDKAMTEICRVLKKDGTLFAPTFIHGEGAGFHIRIRLMNLIGFKTYSKWSADEFVTYIQKQGFRVQSRNVMGSKLTPLCNVIARKQERS